MADVFVVALFMAYIGFYGLFDAQLHQLENNKGDLPSRRSIIPICLPAHCFYYLLPSFHCLGLIDQQMAHGQSFNSSDY